MRSIRAVAGFDWDAGNIEKCREHGVSVDEIESLFRGAPRIAPDVKHSAKEDRLLAIGTGTTGRVLFVAFVFREVEGAMCIRPISARHMHRKEVEKYEEESP